MANHLPMRIKALGMTEKHWSRMEYLHQTVTNPNIHIKGTTAITVTIGIKDSSVPS